MRGQLERHRWANIGRRLLRPAVAVPAICLLILAVNVNVLDNEFISWDDELYVTENPRVMISSLSDLWRVFDPGAARAGQFVEYFPLRDALYALLYLGFSLTPWPYHALQILLHICACILVFFCARDWLGSRAALITLALFAVHPVHVESVAWISALKDPLFFALLLLSLLLYWRYRHAGRARWLYYLGSLACLTLSLLCKSLGVVQPALLVLIDLTFTRGRGPRELITDKLPFVLVALAALIHIIVIGDANRVFVEYPGGTPLSGFLTMTTVFVRYIGMLLAPVGLSARYVIDPTDSPISPIFLASMVTVLALWVAAGAAWKRSRIPLFGLAWFTLCLLPVMNILPIPIEMADRYLYLPSLGLCAALGVLLARWTDHAGAGSRVLIGGAVVLVVAVFSWLSVQRNDVWQDDVTLWTDVLRKAPGFYIGHNNLAAAYLARRRPDRSLEHLHRSLTINPHHARTHHNLGELLRRQGRLSEAERSFQRAVELSPKYAKAHNSLGAIYFERGLLAAARSHFLRAIQITSNYSTAHRNLAMTCLRQKDTSCAVEHIEEAVRLRPHDAGFFNDLITVLARTDQAHRALRWQELLQRRFPDRPKLRARWRALVARAGDHAAAEEPEKQPGRPRKR